MYKVLNSKLNYIDIIVSYNLNKFVMQDIVHEIFLFMWESIIYLLIGNNEKTNSPSKENYQRKD